MLCKVMRCGVFGVTTVYNFCSDGLSNNGARDVQLVTELDPIRTFRVRTQYFPKCTFSDSDCSENLEDLSEKKL
jgi:hypothetical protein